MSDYLTAILLVTGIITLVTSIVVIFLALPVRISLTFRNNEKETTGCIAGLWLILGFEVQVSGKKQQLSILLAGARVFTRPLSGFGNPEKEHKEGPGPGEIPDIVSSLLRLGGPVLDAFLYLLRHTRHDFTKGTARVGLGDPAATGMVYGLYRAVISLLPAGRVNFIVIPEFNQEVFDIDITSRFRITYPVLVLLNSAKVLKHPASRKVMKIMSTKKPGEVAT